MSYKNTLVACAALLFFSHVRISLIEARVSPSRTTEKAELETLLNRPTEQMTQKQFDQWQQRIIHLIDLLPIDLKSHYLQRFDKAIDDHMTQLPVKKPSSQQDVASKPLRIPEQKPLKVTEPETPAQQAATVIPVMTPEELVEEVVIQPAELIPKPVEQPSTLVQGPVTQPEEITAQLTQEEQDALIKTFDGIMNALIIKLQTLLKDHSGQNNLWPYTAGDVTTFANAFQRLQANQDLFASYVTALNTLQGNDPRFASMSATITNLRNIILNIIDGENKNLVGGLSRVIKDIFQRNPIAFKAKAQEAFNALTTYDAFLKKLGSVTSNIFGKDDAARDNYMQTSGIAQDTNWEGSIKPFMQSLEAIINK